MNKAFVREPEPAEPRCPTPDGCDALGVSVTRKTLVAQLGEETAQRLAEPAYYCASSSCDVAYFDGWGLWIPRSALRRPIYPKSPSAPVCACFGVTADDIRADAEAGCKDRVKDLLLRAASAEARCETESPCGRSCAAEVRRLFLRHLLPPEPS